MSQVITRKNLTSASLRGRESAHSVLMRMAIEEERAERVRALKAARPDLTWGRIAEQIGIKERSVLQWQKTGGMDYENAKKFAKLMDVSPDWLWSGVEPQSRITKRTADPSQLDRIEAKLDAILAHFGLSVSDPAEALERELAAAARTSSGRDVGSARDVRVRSRANR